MRAKKTRENDGGVKRKKKDTVTDRGRNVRKREAEERSSAGLKQRLDRVCDWT